MKLMRCTQQLLLSGCLLSKEQAQQLKNIRLTGQVNGKKATLDLNFIRETFGVDTGIIGHPGAGYEYPNEETLAGKGDANTGL